MENIFSSPCIVFCDLSSPDFKLDKQTFPVSFPFSTKFSRSYLVIMKIDDLNCFSNALSLKLRNKHR